MSDSNDSYTSLRSKVEESRRIIKNSLASARSPIVLVDDRQSSIVLQYLIGDFQSSIDNSSLTSVYNKTSRDVDDRLSFARYWSRVLNTPCDFISYNDFITGEYSIGDTVPVEQIDRQARKLLRNELRFAGDTVELNPRGYVGKYLIETVPIDLFIERNDVDVVFSSDRWDEQISNSGKSFIESKETDLNGVEYDKVNPLLPFTELSVWEFTWSEVVPDTVNDWVEEYSVPRSESDLPKNISVDDIPVHKRFYHSKNSGGDSVDDEEHDDEPAWAEFIATNSVESVSDEAMNKYVGEAVRYLEKASGNDDVGLLFTGGKDSVILLHLWKEHVGGHPPLLVVDTKNQFASVYRFRNELAEEWGLEYDVRSNEDFLESVIWNENDDRGFAWDGFKTELCCKRLKVDVIADFIDSGYETLVSGRRSEDVEESIDVIADRSEPLPHRRFHPLHNWDRGVIETYISNNDLPLPDVYDNGYVHTDCVDCTFSGSDGDDWVDASENKRESLQKLRELGYF